MNTIGLQENRKIYDSLLAYLNQGQPITLVLFIKYNVLNTIIIYYGTQFV